MLAFHRARRSRIRPSRDWKNVLSLAEALQFMMAIWMLSVPYLPKSRLDGVYPHICETYSLILPLTI